MSILLKPYADMAGAAIGAGGAIAKWDCGPYPGQANDISRFLPGSCRAAITTTGGHMSST